MHQHLSLIDHDILEDFLTTKPQRDADPLWAFREFESADFNDRRLTRRLQMMARDFGQQPLASIPQACGTWAASKATYRFCSNEKVSWTGILSAHYRRTLERIAESDTLIMLCPQDTTTLNYIAHPATEGLGHVGTQPGRSLGMLLHSTLAVSPTGEFCGLLHAHSWARRNARRSRRSRSWENKDIRLKESFRWVNSFRQVEAQAQLDPTRLWVSVCDREGDFYELFQEALAPGHRAGLLVRAAHDRPLADHRGQTLFKHMRRLASAGTVTVRVPRHGHQPARDVVLCLSFAALRLAAPKRPGGRQPLSLWVVWAKEVAPPKGCPPIRWCLLTTVPVTTLAQAIERIQWYVKRWTIEEFHRVLKSGCRVETRQLTTRARLQRALAIDMVVAWRMIDLNKAARLEPEAPADRWLSADEWQALYCYVHRTRSIPEKPPSISQAVLWIAQLGGFLARKNDGQPGTMTLWRGLQRLNDIVASWQLFGPTLQTRTRSKLHARKTTKRCG